MFFKTVVSLLLGDCGKKGAADIVILMDSSGSVGEENFELMKEFTKSIVDEFVIGSNAVQFGVVIFSTPVTGAFKLNEYTKADQLKAAIDEIEFQNGETHTGKALEYLRTKAFTAQEGIESSVNITMSTFRVQQIRLIPPPCREWKQNWRSNLLSLGPIK